MTIVGIGLLLFIIMQIVSKSSFERKTARYCLALLFFELFANVGKLGNILRGGGISI